MTKEKLTEIMYLFRDLWCQNIDLSTIDEFIDDLAEREVKLFAIPDVSESLLPLDVHKKARELSAGEFINWWFAQKQ